MFSSIIKLYVINGHKGYTRYFTKPTITEQNSQSANSTSNQIPLTANCVNKESTVPKSFKLKYF